MNAEKKLIAEFRKLKGKRCWSVTAGPSTGLAIDLKFGKKIPYAEQEILDNRHLSKDERMNYAEYSLYIAYPWRIDTPTKSIVNSFTEIIHPSSRTYRTLRSLMGRKVKKVVCSRPAFDILIQFSGGISLKVFVLSGSEDPFEYFLSRGRHTHFAVDSSGKAEYESE